MQANVAADIPRPSLQAVDPNNLHFEAASADDDLHQKLGDILVCKFVANAELNGGSTEQDGAPLETVGRTVLQGVDQDPPCFLHQEIRGSTISKEDRRVLSSLPMDTGGQKFQHGYLQQSRQSLGKYLVIPSVLDQLGQQIVQTGGVTFVSTGITGALSAIVFLNELDSLVEVLLKCYIVTPLLAWYWISGNAEIRQVTDTMFLTWIKTTLGWQFWPKIVRDMAEKIQP
jgi:hypothetical protein